MRTPINKIKQRPRQTMRAKLAVAQTTHGICIPVQKIPAERQHQPRTCSVHTASAINRQLCLHQALSAPYAETLSQKTRHSKFGKTENQQLRIQDPRPKPHYDHQLSSYRYMSTRFCSTFSHSAKSSFRSTVDASSNTRDTGSQVLSASPSPSHAALSTTLSPLAARAIVEMLRMWYSP